MAELFRILTLIVASLAARSSAQHKTLYKNLFANYEKDLRPVINDSSTVTISVQMYFKQVLKVIESDQIITVYCWLEQYWVDQFLTWDPAMYGGIETLHVPGDMVWKPDLMVYNNANMNVKENELHTNAIISFNGSVSLFRAVITDITCHLDMTFFPFDQQLCFLMLASWTHDGSQVQLHAMRSHLEGENLAYYIQNMEWSLLDWNFRLNQKYYECCPNAYPDISYYFVLKRNPAYYLMTLIVPSAFITIVTIVGFFTPHSSSGENTEKVSLGVTALLSLAIILMMVSDKLPATSKVVPLLGRYYVGLIVIMFSATCATTLALTIQMKGNGGKRLPPSIKYIVTGDIFNDIFPKKKKPKSRTDEINQNDEVSVSLLKDSWRQEADKQSAQIHKRPPFSPHPNSTEKNAIEKLKNDIFVEPLKELTCAVNAIRERLEQDTELDMIRKDWQKLARVLERVFMVLFIGVTVGFAVVMLRDSQEPIEINQAVMDSLL